jgi:hypothetical protein
MRSQLRTGAIEKIFFRQVMALNPSGLARTGSPDHMIIGKVNMVELRAAQMRRKRVVEDVC